MSELTITLLRLGLLAMLWVFVFAVAGVLRGDLYGTRVISRRAVRRGQRAGAQPAFRSPKPVAAGAAAAGYAASAPTPDAPRRGRAAARAMPTHLVVIEGQLSGTSIPLRDSGTLIGRNPESALVLDDDYASGRHLKIHRTEQGWVAEDLGSTNGTFLGNNRLTEPTPVEVGTRLRIGKTVVELQR